MVLRRRGNGDRPSELAALRVTVEPFEMGDDPIELPTTEAILTIVVQSDPPAEPAESSAPEPAI